eukprot:520145-Alexandrium_andersonii.AAC.1
MLNGHVPEEAPGGEAQASADLLTAAHVDIDGVKYIPVFVGMRQGADETSAAHIAWMSQSIARFLTHQLLEAWYARGPLGLSDTGL